MRKEESKFKYRAFISYAHADHEWGVWIHRSLEKYSLPRGVIGPNSEKRLGKVFRDEEELGAAAELGLKIESALNSSDALIVVCSPRSARSRWVDKEISAFKRIGRGHRTFALIIDGEPHDPEHECFPEALKKTISGEPSEPLAVDIRKFGRDDAALRLVAGILDLGYDDLRQREHRRRRAELIRARVLFSTGLLLIGAALVGGYLAAKNYVDASELSSRLFAREANLLSEKGLHAKAILMAVHGDPAARVGLVEEILRPNGYDDTRSALVRAFVQNRLLLTYTGHNNEIQDAVFSETGKWITSIDSNEVHIWSASDGKTHASWPLPNPANGLFSKLSFDGEILITNNAGSKEVMLWHVSVDSPLVLYTTLSNKGDGGIKF